MKARTRSLGNLLQLLIAVAIVFAGVAHAEDWDAQRALEQAMQLETVIEQALEASEKALPQETTWQQRTRDAAVTEMKHVYEASRGLVTKLRIGAGRDATEPLFFQLRSMFEHALKTAQDAVPRAEVGPLLTKAESLILDLQKLYAGN